MTKEVEIKPSGKSIQYYKDKGYDVKWRQPLVVKVEDLPRGSSVKLEVLCDFCKKEKRTITYYDYMNSIEKYGEYACNKCAYQKTQMTSLEKYGEVCYSKTEEYKNQRKQDCLERYGVEDYFQTEEFKEKKRQYNLEMYGVDNYAKTKECHEKMESTMEKLYGVKYAFQSNEIKDRAKRTWIEKYGYKNPSCSFEIKEKIRNTNFEKYGCFNPMQLPEIRAKMNETLCKNGTQKTSKQQLYLYSLYGGKLNFFVKYYATDICFQDEKLVIEYDGGGHDLRVKLGRLTQEEFDHKEIVRSSVLKSEGYKQMRIISTNDKLPSDEKLLELLSYARNYFSEYPEHSWIEFSIDTSTIRNAEHKQGISYQYGELRTIKDTDLQNSQNETNATTAIA